MKILVVITNGMKREGVTTTQLEFFRVMDKTDMIIDIAAVGEIYEDVVDEFQKYGCNVVIFPNRKKSPINYIRKLWKTLKSNHYDIIHVHGSSSIMVIELFAAKLAGIKVRIAHSRNTSCDHKLANAVLRPIFDKSYNVAFACGEEAGKWLFRKKDFIVIHNGKDLDKFCFDAKIRDDMRCKFELSDQLTVGFVGNLKEQKNPFFLLDIFKAIHDKKPSSRFFIIGDGDLRQEIEIKAQELGIYDETHFMGRISYVSEMLQAMDIMLLPSKWEGLPNVVIEWQASGLPCIVSDTVTKECKLTDLVHFMSIHESPEQWAAKVTELKLGGREHEAELAQQELKRAGFDLRENASSLRKKYFELVGCKTTKKQ